MMDDVPSASVRNHRPSELELRAAIESLYADELEPLGRLLRRRLLEQLGPSGNDYRDAPLAIDAKVLRDLCDSCPDVAVVPLPRNEYAALITDRTPCFVDVNSDVDPYDDDTWQKLAEYLRNAAGTVCFPCDRYECAKVLRAGGPPFLAERTLGEVCHIASLAIGPRKLLERVGGSIVPLISCEGFRSRTPGAALAPSSASEEAPDDRQGELLPTATVEEVRAYLPEMLDMSTCPSEGAMYMSHVQALFRDRHHLHLSAEALGHDRLESVFHSHHFADLCEVAMWGDEVLLERRAHPGAALYYSQFSRPTYSAHYDRGQAANAASRYGNSMLSTYGPSPWAGVHMMPMGPPGGGNRGRPHRHYDSAPPHYHWPAGDPADYADYDYYNGGWGMVS